MKRTSDTITIWNKEISVPSENYLHTSKKFKARRCAESDEFLMDFEVNPVYAEQMVPSAYTEFVISGKHTLVNPDYVAKEMPHDFMELGDCSLSDSQFVTTNVNHKVGQIGKQMMSVQENLRKTLEDAQRDSILHMAACNFVKKSGQTYHLYERSSGQQYFSMLSPEDWYGNSPHKFLGSWYLEADKSWIPAEEMHLRKSLQ